MGIIDKCASTLRQQGRASFSFIGVTRKRLALVASALACGILLSSSFAPPLGAEEAIQSDRAVSRLAEFAREIESRPLAFAGPRIDDDTAAALQQFAQRLGTGAPDNAASGLMKLAATGAEATYIGAQACAGCHAGAVASYNKTLMGRINLSKQTIQCESCHGPGSEHVKAGGGRGVGGLVSFRPDDKSRSNAENNAICLGCHDKGDHALWQGSAHESRGLACTNCHTVMRDVSRKSQLKTAYEGDTCFQCHKNKRAEIWRTSHMPVREGEGKLTCSSCHNPHGSFGDSLLKQATINDTCYTCHAEKRGPYLWEHAPVRENCLSCHDAHGSRNEFMLNVSRPRLCHQCHTGGHPGGPQNPTAAQAFNRGCQNCHTQVHGSNSPSGVRLTR